MLSPTTIRFLVLLAAFLAVSPTSAKKVPSTVGGMSDEAVSIVTGTVASIDTIGDYRYAVLNVHASLKGSPQKTLTFYAQQRSLCDTTWAEVGDDLVLFLELEQRDNVVEALRDLRQGAPTETLYSILDLGSGRFTFPRDRPSAMVQFDHAVQTPTSWHVVPGPEQTLPNGAAAEGRREVSVQSLLDSISACVTDRQNCPR
jgi:hypothetical protein